MKDNKIYNTALYCRLSLDDGSIGESGSIQTQKIILEEYAKMHGFKIYDVYVDDGYSGLNFNRPGFQRMIQDIQSGKINLVITKDLSRLGRNYIETGYYTEHYFKDVGVRYIAINDGIDTINDNNDIAPFKNILNDMYSKDLSRKVKAAKRSRNQKGLYTVAQVPYGYKKDQTNKNKILVDENVAKNVKLIFDLYKSGKSKTEIAKELNKLEISTPLKYKQETTNYYNPNSNATYKWNSTVINKILRNPIYVGDLVQLQYNKVNYKIKKIKKVPEEEQIVILNNHEAIIDRNTFNTVQEMLNKQTNEWNYSNRKNHLLTGLVFCKCGSRITYNKNHGKVFRCVCSSYKKYGNKFCSNIHLKEAELLQMVASSLKKNVNTYLNLKDLKYPSIVEKDNRTQELAKLYKEKEKINKTITNLYEDKISSNISLETFKILIKKYEKQKKEIDMKISTISKSNKNTQELKLNQSQLENVMKQLLKFDTINEENKGLVLKLIDKIIIDDDKINIKYKFNNLEL